MSDREMTCPKCGHVQCLNCEVDQVEIKREGETFTQYIPGVATCCQCELRIRDRKTVMSSLEKRCGTCARGWIRDNGKIGCGAPVDEDALSGDVGVNPIWAERKYGRSRVLMLFIDPKAATEPIGSDPANMDPTDGADCKMWKAG